MSGLKRMMLGAIAAGLMAGVAPAKADFWSDAGKDLAGVTIRGVSESTPPSNYVKDVLAPAFTKATGINVEFEATSWDQMYDKAIKDMEANTGIYDFVYIEQDAVYGYLGRDFLVDLTKFIAENPKLKAPDYDPANFTTFANYFKGKDGDLFGVPMEAFIKVYLYRKDLFEDPQVKAAFKAKYNRDLAPAKTHAEYTEIADFFTQWGKDKGIELWGSTVQANTGHPSSWYEYVESVAPTFGVYNWGIDAANNYAATVEHGGKMNSPEAKAALQFWLDLLKNAPPESTASTWSPPPSAPAAPHRAWSMARTLPGSPPTTRSRRLSARSASPCRRLKPVSWKPPKPEPAISATTMAAPSASRTRRRTRPHRHCSFSTSPSLRSRPIGPSPAPASRSREPMTTRR
jgi:multiple sugar transport system substrate-binding protein